MRQWLLRMFIAVALVGIGWVAGQAQEKQPDFEIRVTAPAGQTLIECVRGCNLAWVERGVMGDSSHKDRFNFGCSGSTAGTCSSGRVGGWIKP